MRIVLPTSTWKRWCVIAAFVTLGFGVLVGGRWAWRLADERSVVAEIIGKFGITVFTPPPRFFWDGWLPSYATEVQIEPDKPLDEEIARLLQRLPELQVLSLPDGSVCEAAWTHLAGLRRLKILHLEGAQISSAGLAMLVEVPLEEVDARDTDIDDTAVVHLARIPTLTCVRLSGTRVSSRGLKALASLPKLETLDVSYTAVDEEGLSCLGGLKRLRSLDLGGTRVNSRGLEVLGQLPGLRELRLDSCIIDDAACRHLAGLNELQVLDLSDTNVTSAGLVAVGRLPQLVELRLTNTAIDDDAFQAHEHFARLETLGLHATRVGDAGVKRVANFRRLRRLDLGETQVTDAGVAALADLSQLTELSLRSTKTTDRGVGQLACLGALRSLCLDCTPITDASVASIGKMAALECLSVRETRLTENALNEVFSRMIGAGLSADGCGEANSDPLPGRKLAKVKWLPRKDKAIHRFPLRAVREFDTLARKTFCITPELRAVPGWFHAITIDATRFQLLRPLILDPKYRLVVCMYGMGLAHMAWACPTEFADTCPSTLTTEGRMLPNGMLPRPPGSMDDLLTVIRGDDSPWSYLCASFLRRNAENLPRQPYCITDWSLQELIASPSSLPSPRLRSTAWQWYGLPPSRWVPRVETTETMVKVTFYTVFRYDDGELSAEVVQHTDVYTRGDLRCRSDVRVVGTTLTRRRSEGDQNQPYERGEKGEKSGRLERYDVRRSGLLACSRFARAAGDRR